MAKSEFTDYQRGVVSRYYESLDGIVLQKLGELVSEIYLADSEGKRKRLWDRTHKAMVTLKIPPAIVGHIMEKRDVEILAKNLKDWLGGKGKRKNQG